MSIASILLSSWEEVKNLVSGEAEKNLVSGKAEKNQERIETFATDWQSTVGLKGRDNLVFFSPAN